VLLLVEPAVQRAELVADPVEPLEQRVQLAVVETLALHGPILARELCGAADDPGARAEPLEQPLPRARAGLQGLEPPRDPELRRGDAGQRLRRVGEGPEPDAVGAQPPQRRVDLRARTEVHRRVLLGEALQEGAPIPNEAVENARRGGAILRKLDLHSCSSAKVFDPLAPEPMRVTEHAIEVERERPARAQGPPAPFLDSAAMSAEEKPPAGIARLVTANPVFVVTALGLILYGLLRLANSLFYDPLAVKPEEVGLGYAETLSQSAVGVFIVLLTSLFVLGILFVLLIFFWAWMRRGEPGGGKLENLLVAVVVAGILTGTALHQWVPSHVANVVWAVLEVLFLLWILYRVWHEVRSGRVKRVLLLAGSAFTLSVVLTLATVMLQAWGDSRGVRDGQVRHPEFLGFVPFGSWGADAAWVEWVAPHPPKGFETGRRRCLVYLGRTNGTAVFYDASARDDKTLRLPSNAVVITTRNSRHQDEEACP
jgi:hypothetical protein